MGIKRIEKTRTEEITPRAGVRIASETIREARLRWLGHVERKTEEDVVMRTWKMEVSGHQKIGRLNRCGELLYKNTCRRQEYREDWYITEEQGKVKL